MKEFMINFRGYDFIWAENEDDAKKLFKKHFRKMGCRGELEHLSADPYQDDEKEQLWKENK